MLQFKGGPDDGKQDSGTARGKMIIAQWEGEDVGYILKDETGQPIQSRWKGRLHELTDHLRGRR